MEHVEYLLIQAVSHLEPFRGAGHVANLQVDAGGGGPQIDSGIGAKPAESTAVRATFPFLFRDKAILARFVLDSVKNAVHSGRRVHGRRDRDRNLVPRPLAAGRKIEELAANGEAIHKADAAARGISPGREIPLSSRVVVMRPTSVTSPATPLISTQSPTRMPRLPT